MRKTILYEVVQKEVMSGDYIEFIIHRPSLIQSLKHVIGTSDVITPMSYEVTRLPVRAFMRDCDSRVQYYAFSPELQEIVDCIVEEQSEISWKIGKDFGYNRGVENTKKEFSHLSLFQRIKKAIKGEL